MHAYLGDLRLAAELDRTGPLVYVRLPGTSDEISLNDAYDGVGPLALLHYEDQRPANELPVEYDGVDGVAVYRVTTALGDLLFPASLVPVLPRR